MIQISLKSKLIVWDLYHNIEVDAIEDYAVFMTPETFIDNGFNLSKTITRREKSGEKVTKMIRMISNKTRTAYCMSYDASSDLVGFYFKPYTMMDLV